MDAGVIAPEDADDISVLLPEEGTLDTGTMDSLMEAASFVQTIQNRQGVVISAPEEIAYRRKWISKSKLLESADLYGKSPYGEHLRRVAMDMLHY